MSGLFARLKHGLSRSRQSLSQLIPAIDRQTLSDQEWVDVEDALIMADCGAALSASIVQQSRKSRSQPLEALRQVMRHELARHDTSPSADKHSPFVLLVIGVNGTGKTTTIGKLATMYRKQGKSVLVGACDTFRAAAVEQLAVWVDRAGADMVRQQEGADPAAVAFDTVQRGLSKKYDIIIIDTAGRVQTDTGLMNELAKVSRVISKALPDAPHQVWQVLDGGTGQNAIAQVEKFRDTAGTTGLIITKLDGTAKGGIVLQLFNTFHLPVQYVGVGEALEDLMPFEPHDFIDSLLPESLKNPEAQRV
ncbi:MAG: signal recognition particle-docking protein FtsY [Zetaproteobacteria bacterium CG_4_9_14_3_um_filter_49_83]|nr:MAG: signal recognition particle-docking protein FtsY [Zetaproteobacteria bacterium CG1_02_49_23]PIQ34457.1 MAG: signal recognition particle-docking protein FtsY [Zetaproteobacteria bacterium CG17_big_fil_post_rev_8_21_14_2_50_50_13]PIV29066.1 MAG: signal recognition particle-docking protein FtsY [Zetaproteobacteria bacterium CG02_land_8_20_14_3_00_50_9]PIY56440.1 MAG: signal recognition particle-docking protein FtsY [Zetaproteobacteria bacterium CG_4_10_14_0_8_um_filter_49_80]PJA34079.1 MAG